MMTSARKSLLHSKWLWLFLVILCAVAAFTIWWVLGRTDIIYRGPPIQVGGGTIQERELVLMESAPDQEKVDFLKRVGALLVEHSDRTGHEACGQICQNRDSTRFAVQIVTNDAHIMCAMWTTCPTGYIHTGENIHSHCPGPRRLRANSADRALSANRIKRGDQLQTCDPHNFSSQDYAVGPGYLATPDRLIFQSGRDSVADLGELPAYSATGTAIVATAQAHTGFSGAVDAVEGE